MDFEAHSPPQEQTRAGTRPRGLPILLVVLVLTTSCTTVAPSQRGYLAKPEMSPVGEAGEEAFHSHIEAAREGAMGGHGVQGGGCGCG